MDELVAKTIAALRRNNMAGYFVSTQDEVLALLSGLIPPQAAVGSGDSITLEQLGVFDFLRRGGYTFYDKFEAGLSSDDKRKLYLKNFTAHSFVTGTNALTVDGRLFNIDGNGNRVAPIIYGPEQVIVVVGTNKIVHTVDEAVERTRQIAAPQDARRLGRNTPCATLGRCVDCKHEQRICNDFVLISGQFVKDRIKVVIVNQSLGY